MVERGSVAATVSRRGLQESKTSSYADFRARSVLGHYEIGEIPRRRCGLPAVFGRANLTGTWVLTPPLRSTIPNHLSGKLLGGLLQTVKATQCAAAHDESHGRGFLSQILFIVRAVEMLYSSEPTAELRIAQRRKDGSKNAYVWLAANR